MYKHSQLYDHLCSPYEGGNAKIRPYWKNYFENTDVLIFVVSFRFNSEWMGTPKNMFFVSIEG